MTPREIALLETPEQRETAIRNEIFDTFDEVRKTAISFNRESRNFIEAYKNYRRAQVKNDPAAPDMLRNLDSMAARITGAANA